MLRLGRVEGVPPPLEAACYGADLESYVAIHQGVIFGSLTLLTGSIWAQISWGVWWSWGSNQLVLFLVLFLFYAAYFMLRFSVEAGPARANMSAVYALFGVVLIPVELPRDQARQRPRPPDRLQEQRAAMARLDVLHVLRRVGRDAAARVALLPLRAGRQAARRAAARAAGTAGVRHRLRRRPQDTRALIACPSEMAGRPAGRSKLRL